MCRIPHSAGKSQIIPRLSRGDLGESKSWQEPKRFLPSARLFFSGLLCNLIQNRFQRLSDLHAAVFQFCYPQLQPPAFKS